MYISESAHAINNRNEKGQFWRRVKLGAATIASLVLLQLPAWSASVAAATPGTSARYGIAGGGELAYQSPARLATYMQDLRSLNVGRVRFDIDWDAIQNRDANTYDWSGYDPVVKAAVAQGLEVDAVITHTPKWARAADCVNVSSRCRPIDPVAYAHFCGEAAKRYAPLGVHDWEIWNEPNLSALWLPAVDPAAYVEFLKQASAAIRANDPQSLVLLGGLTHTFTSNGNNSPADFLRVIYEHGGGNAFDAVAIHPYTYPFVPQYTGEPTGWKDLTDVHNLLIAEGQPDKKIWITEFGAPTGGPLRLATSGWTRTDIGCDHVTEDLQKQIFDQASAFVQNTPWIDVFFWYSYQDKGTDESNTENFYGILRADGSHKSIYDDFVQAVRTSR